MAGDGTAVAAGSAAAPAPVPAPTLDGGALPGRQIDGLGKNRLGYINAALAYTGICGIAPVYACLAFAIGLATAPLPPRLAMVPQDWLYWSFQEFMRLYFEIYPGLRVRFHGDRPRDESCVYIANHQSNMDWFISVLLAGETKSSGKLRYMLKDTLAMLPLFGWAFSLHGCVYVAKRSRGGGADHLVGQIREIADDDIPVWFVVFPEGTRYNPVRYPWQLDDSARAAAKHGEDPRSFTHVKYPRSGGFACAVLGLGPHAAAVYDVTVAYTASPPGSNAPHRPALCTMESMMSGQFREVHIHLRRTPVAALPKSSDALRAWLVEQFRRKNRMLERFYGAALADGASGSGDDANGVGVASGENGHASTSTSSISSSDGALGDASNERDSGGANAGGTEDAGLSNAGSDDDIGPEWDPRPSAASTIACAVFWNALMAAAALTSRGRRVYATALIVGGAGGTLLAAARLALGSRGRGDRGQAP